MEQKQPIIPTAVYDDDDLYRMMEVSSTTMSKARVAGQIRYTRKGKRTLYLGRWVLDWLNDGKPSEDSPSSNLAVKHLATAVSNLYSWVQGYVEIEGEHSQKDAESDLAEVEKWLNEAQRLLG